MPGIFPQIQHSLQICNTNHARNFSTNAIFIAIINSNTCKDHRLRRHATRTARWSRSCTLRQSLSAPHGPESLAQKSVWSLPFSEDLLHRRALDQAPVLCILVSAWWSLSSAPAVQLLVASLFRMRRMPANPPVQGRQGKRRKDGRRKRNGGRKEGKKKK